MAIIIDQEQKLITPHTKILLNAKRPSGHVARKFVVFDL